MLSSAPLPLYSPSLPSPHAAASSARSRELRQKLFLTMAATMACTALIALLGDDSGYRRALAQARSFQKLDDSTDSTAAKDLFGEQAGGGYTGVSHFEPSPTADYGIAQSNFPGDYMGGSQDMDYSYDVVKRMIGHKGEVLQPDNDDLKEQVKKNLDKANKKLDMPGIVSFP
mmetsp:Transcript_48511/g.75763  ORF Transcript_48511/g.75763 Transcript_48511/m.75763 type:complete len:172 (-) Transcript_48511:1239-1754(-)